MKSVLIIAGENSGEIYGAELVRQFKKFNPSISFFGIGGKNMAAEGVKLLFSVDDLSVVGVFEIISHLPRIKKIFNQTHKEVKIQAPIASVLIDSPDFNLRLAKKLKQLSIPVLYFISPTVWAWRKGRLKTIKKTVQKMMLIFPFEVTIYKDFGIPAVYVGHPLKEKINVSLTKEEFFKKYDFDSQKKLISVLPGSRNSELKYHMPVLLEALRKMKKKWNMQFALLLAESIDKNLLSKFLHSNIDDVKVFTQDHYEAIASSDLALSSCGTANLEAALLETPFISFYRIFPLTYLLGVKFVKVKTYSIVNILAGEKIVPELIQKDFTSENIVLETEKILDSEETRSKMKSHFQQIQRILGEEKASQNAARELEKLIQNRKGYCI